MKPSEKYCKQQGFEVNEHGVFIYTSKNGKHIVDMPSILEEFAEPLVKQIEKLEDELEEGCDCEPCDDCENCEFDNATDEWKHELFMDNYGKFTVEQFETFINTLK